MAADGEIDSESTDTEETGKPNIKHWISQLKAAEKAAKKSRADTREAWEEYLGGKGEMIAIRDQTNKAPAVRYPIFWSSVKTIQPALYSRTPIPLAEKVFDNLDDNIARISGLCHERLAKYLMRSTCFDRTLYSTRDDFIISGKTTNRVCFDSEITNKPKKVYYVQTQTADQQGQPVTVWIDNEGQPPPQDAQMQQNEEGTFIESMEETLENVCVSLMPVHYCDYLHTPNARYQQEIDWMAFKSMMVRHEIEERFGKDIAEKLKYDEYKDKEDKKTQEADISLPTKYACIWEIWDKENEQVYWRAEGYDEDFIDVKDDPYELEGFFPCPPFLLGTIGPDTMYAIPDYIQLRPLIFQLHGLAARLKTLIRAARRRGIYDSSVTELKRLEDEADEGEFIGVANFKELVGDGGLEAIVKYFPVQEITQAVEQMSQVIAMYEQKFNEIYGIPDILRGVSDPQETAAAQQLKGKFLSLRFSSTQRAFQELVRCDIELMCDLALKKFPEGKLAEIMGFSHMNQQDQALFPQALLLLKDDRERKVRIDIETDSTITMNQNAEIDQRNLLAKTIFDGLTAVATASQGNPMFAPVAMTVLQYIVQGLQKGKEIEEVLKQAMIQMSQPQQPAPDPAMVKAQADMALADKKLQNDVQVVRMKTEADMALQDAKVQAEIYQEDRASMQKMQLEQFDAQHQIQLKQIEAQLAALKEKLAQDRLDAKSMTDSAAEQQKRDNETELKFKELQTKLILQEHELQNKMKLMREEMAAEMLLKREEMMKANSERMKSMKKTIVLTPMGGGKMSADVTEH